MVAAPPKEPLFPSWGVTISAVPQVYFQACKGCAHSCWLSDVTKLVTLRQYIQINLFYKPIKPQPAFKYRFVL